MRSPAMKYNAEFTEAGRSHFKPFVGQTSSSFETVGGRAGNGSMGHGSRVKWVTKIGWVTWVMGH